MIAKKESLELAEMIGKWFEKEVKPVCGELDEKGEFPADLYEGMAELGLNIMCVSRVILWGYNAMRSLTPWQFVRAKV